MGAWIIDNNLISTIQNVKDNYEKLIKEQKFHSRKLIEKLKKEHNIEIKRNKIELENAKKETENIKIRFETQIKELKMKNESNKEEVFKKIKNYINDELGKNIR